MTPPHSFKNKKLKKELADVLGGAFVEDISKKLRTKHCARSQMIIYGDREEEPVDIIVPRTGHRLNARYIKEIAELL